MTRVKRRRIRWAAGGVSALVAATGAVALGTGTARAATSPGIGSSYAQAFQDTPEEGSLRVGVVLAEAIAGHTNYVARAQSQSLDLTAIGTSLQGYNCGSAPSQTQLGLVPQPLQTETGQAGAAQGQTVQPTDGLSTESSSQPVPPSFGGTEHVQATQDPYGEADTDYGNINVPGNPFEVSGMHSKATSGLVNGKRVATATTDINSLSLMGGQVVMNGLEWTVTYPSGGAGQPTGSFSIGKLVINGTAVPTADPTAALAAVNQALAPLGLDFEAPKTTKANGVEFVSPLQLNVVPNSNRDQVLTAIVNGSHQVTGPLENGLENGFSGEPPQLVQATCQSDTPITVADIAVASVDGSGSYITSFGGVNATSGAAPVDPFNLSLGGFGGSLSTTQYIPGTPAVAGSSGSAALSSPAAAASPSTSGALSSATPTGGTSTSPASGSAGQNSSQPTQNIAAVGHAAGGPLLGIGLGGLAALLLLAEGDRRLMRRAQMGGTFSDFEE